MQALTIDFELVSQSMRDLSRSTQEYFLDRNTGKVLALSRDLMHALAHDEVDEREVLPQWEAQMIPISRQIILNGSTHYLRIPEAYGRPEHRWMLEFAETVRIPKLKQKLILTLRGRGCCKRFKEALKDSPNETKRWSIFRAQQWKDKIQSWLESFGIIAIDQYPHKEKAVTKS